MNQPPPQSPDFLPLLERAKTGETAAQAELFERYCGKVEKSVHRILAYDLRVGRPWVHSRFSTGDVVQEVFRSVLGNLSSFEGKTEHSFEGYLAMIVRNRLVDAIRFHEAERRDGRRAGPPPMENEHVSSEPAPERLTEEAEQTERFLECLAEFPEREQLLVRARIEGLGSFEDLAEQLGYSSTSKAQRAFNAVKARLAVRLTGPRTGYPDADAAAGRTNQGGPHQ